MTPSSSRARRSPRSRLSIRTRRPPKEISRPTIAQNSISSERPFPRDHFDASALAAVMAPTRRGRLAKRGDQPRLSAPGDPLDLAGRQMPSLDDALGRAPDHREFGPIRKRGSRSRHGFLRGIEHGYADRERKLERSRFPLRPCADDIGVHRFTRARHIEQLNNNGRTASCHRRQGATTPSASHATRGQNPKLAIGEIVPADPLRLYATAFCLTPRRRMASSRGLAASS
jgi:hypothetical protein